MSESAGLTTVQAGGTLDGMPARLPSKVTTKDPVERLRLARLALNIASSNMYEYQNEKKKGVHPFSRRGRLGYGRATDDPAIARVLAKREEIGKHLRYVREALGLTILNVARALDSASDRSNIAKIEEKAGQRFPTVWIEPLVLRLLAFYAKEVKKLERAR